MTNGNRCPQCGREIPPDAPGGECPVCRDQTRVRPRQQTESIGSDHDLLFGVLAVQLRLISSDQFVQAAAAWATDRQIRLGERMIAEGMMSREDVELVNNLVRRAIAEHDGDLSATLRESRPDVDVLERLPMPTGHGDVIDLVPGDQIELMDESPGRYTRTSEYSRGGMGRILLVHDQFLDRDVAMKELLPPSDDRSGDSPVKAVSRATVRFLREARVTGQLEHPSIVPVYEVGRRPNGTLYYTMKLVRGRTLSRALQQTKTLAERLSYLSHFLDLCHALAYAHQRNVVHRDIKPTNIMVGDFGETVVIDWGLAKVLGRSEDDEAELARTWTELRGHTRLDLAETADGMRLGTPQYMAPEQVEGRIHDIDRRTDVFALGIVLYQILTSEIPFQATSSEEIYDQITNLNYTPVQDLIPDVPPELASICQRAMQKQRQNRYQSAKELADEIQRFLTGAVVHTYNYTPLELARNVYRRHRVVANTVAAAAALLLITGIVSYINIYRSRNQAVIAKNRETVAKTAEAQARDAAEAANYVTQIRLAQSLIQESNYARARQVLWSTDPARRHWEWGVLVAKAYPELYTLDGYQGFGVSHDSRYLVRAHLAKPIQVHHVVNGRMLTELPVDPGANIVDQRFSPDNSLLVAWTSNRTLLAWDTSTWQSVALPAFHDGRVNDLLFLPNNQLVTCGNEATVRLWDLSDGRQVGTLQTDSDSVDFIQASADGARIMSGRDGGDLQIWDLAAAQLVSQINQAELSGTPPAVGASSKFHRLSPSGRQVAFDRGDQVMLWDVDQGKLARVLSGNHSHIVSIQFDSTGARILVGGGEGTTIIWDTSTGEQLHTIGINSSLLKSIWSPDDSFLCTHPLSGMPRLWSIDGPRPKLVNKLGQHRLITPFIGFSPDSERIITADGSGAVKVWSTLASSHQSIVGTASEAIRHVSASADVTRVAIDAGRASLAVVDRRRNLSLFELQVPMPPASAAPRSVISPNGKFVVSSVDPFRPIVYHIDAEQFGIRYSRHDHRVNAIGVTPDSSRVVTATWGGSVHVWNPQTAELEKSMQHTAEIETLAIRNDHQVAAGDSNGLVVLYDLRTGQAEQQIELADSSITALRWSSDGNVLTAGHADGRVTIWPALDERHPAQSRTLGKHLYSVNAIGFVADERLLSFTKSDSRVWNIKTGEEILSSNDGADDFIRLTATGDLLSCSRDLLLHWNSVGQHVAIGQQAGSVEQQQQKFQEFRRQRLARTRPRYPIGTGERQFVMVTRSQAREVLLRLAETIGQTPAPDADVDSASPGQGIPVLAGPMSAAAPELGIRTADRITRIATQSVTDATTASQAIELAIQSLDDDPAQFSINVIRNGSAKQLRVVLDPLHETTRTVPLERDTAIEMLQRFTQGYRQTGVTEQQLEGTAEIFIEDAQTDRALALAAQLSESDRIVGFNNQKTDNYNQLLDVIDDFLQRLRSGQTSTFSMDVRRGVSQVVHLQYQIE